MEHSEVFEIDLLKLVRALLKKLWIIVLVAAVMAGSVFAYGKMTYKPSYRASATLYIKGAEDDIAYTTSDAQTRIKTCIQVMKLTENLEAVIDAADVELDAKTLSGMVSGSAVNNSELFKIKVTGADQETVLKLVETVAQLLPEMVEPIHGENTIGTFESSITVEEVSKEATKQPVVAAVLGGLLVCAVVVGKELYTDWKETRRKDA